MENSTLGRMAKVQEDDDDEPNMDDVESDEEPPKNNHNEVDKLIFAEEKVLDPVLYDNEYSEQSR